MNHRLDKSQVHHEWNNALPPRLEVAPGDTVTFETRDASDQYYSPSSTHDDVIKRNDRVQNPYPTILEGLKAKLTLPTAGVAAFGSWDAFNEIVEHTPGSIMVNAGYAPFATSDKAGMELSRMQFETPTAWNSVRHDAYTFGLAMTYFRTHQPRVLYLALGETDDWAHERRYDRVLETLARTDEWFRQLWTWIESQPTYRGRTHILITTDHGRGRTPADWNTHGAKVEGAQEVGMVFISPAITQRGEWRDHAPIHTNQAAATMADWLGVDWTAGRPGVGRPTGPDSPPPSRRATSILQLGERCDPTRSWSSRPRTIVHKSRSRDFPFSD